MKKKNILITGGNGFLGSYLIDRLLKQNIYNIYVIDNNKTIGGVNYKNPKVINFNADITNPKIYKKLEKIKFEYVFHLAAQSAGETSYDDPSYDILTNSYGTYLVSNFCVKNKVKKLIYTLTVAVYGNYKGSVKETDEIKPDSIYGASKYTGELFVKQLLDSSKVKYTIFRVFNVFGPGENLNFLKKGIVSIYLGYIWRKEPLIVKGSLNRFRDIIYISDAIDALILSMNRKKSDNQIYNLASGKKIIIKDLIKKIKYNFQLDKKYPIKVKDSTPGDSFGFHANINKIKKDLSWSPKISINEGLKNYNLWIKKVPITLNLKQYHPLLLKDKKTK